MRAPSVIAATGVAALLIVAGQAQAQANRTFVSGSGSDTNPCSLAAPCRSFAQAITQTNSGGEITILDPAGYGPVTINKAISIVNDGVGEAGVTVTSATDGIDITVGPSDVVNLRGLTLVGGGVGATGILFSNLGALNVQNCVIRGFVNGILLEPTGTAAFNISDTIVSNTNTGVSVAPVGSGAVTAAFNRVQTLEAGSVGIQINGTTAAGGALNVTIANSVAANDGFGIAVGSTNVTALTQVMVSNSVVSNNGTGISDSGSNSTTYLGKNTIAGNTTAFSVTGGSMFSFGDNYIKSNGNDGGAIVLVSAK